MTLQATLYTKPGCHLCEQAVEDLVQLRRRHPHVVREVDISSDVQLMQRYAERIPVLVINGHEYSAPLSGGVLERALVEAEAHAT